MDYSEHERCVLGQTHESNGKMNSHHEIYLPGWRRAMFLCSVQRVPLYAHAVEGSLQLGGVGAQLKMSVLVHTVEKHPLRETS